MQCKSCGTELPKKAKICPKCGALNGKPAGNTRYLAIIGMVIMLIGGLLPFAKSNETLMDGYTPKAYSFGFMNISVIAMWYIFMTLIFIKPNEYALERKVIYYYICGSYSCCIYFNVCIPVY